MADTARARIPRRGLIVALAGWLALALVATIVAPQVIVEAFCLPEPCEPMTPIAAAIEWFRIRWDFGSGTFVATVAIGWVAILSMAWLAGVIDRRRQRGGL